MAATGLRVKSGEIIMENRKDSDNYLPESQSIWSGHWEEVGVSGKKYFRGSVADTKG